MGSRKRQLTELIQFGQAVSEQVRGPVADTIRAKVANWRDPRARLLRKRRRAGRVTAVWGGMTAIGGGLVIGQAADLSGPGGIAAICATALFGWFATSSGVKTIKLYRTPLPEPPVPLASLPPNGSAAREPMRALAEAEAGLAELLRQLGTPSAVGVAPLPAESVAHARVAAAEAAAAIRAVAEQLVAVERARDIVPIAQRAELSAGVRKLREQVDEGVEGYRALVAAAGQAVLTSNTATAPNQALLEASDHLTGLASALRELS
ncbi:hypothetical protein GCM10010174_64030 [Kutzneria viridogrisea]|uniref:Uncharacterized protein n=2 Tax=Kutzneria TaxID=43356 RepID=W5WQQ2_9PSEU|nr:hypothetical protein [Kutzneria albida]AHI00510.1 hypothetical protein KALB_7152 [Kutzneria albida DSM 43870]MBA8925689.1 hypothetical protein [Kutzneria viridogrisea]